MEHIAALLLIVGCSQDLSACAELPAPVAFYETTTDCDYELPGILSGLTGAKPRVMATCVAVDPALEEADAELVWDVTPQGKLVATLEAPQVQVASVGHMRTEQ